VPRAAIGPSPARHLVTVHLPVQPASAVGTILADIALGATAPADAHYYARVVRDRPTWTTPSALAQRDDTRDALWNDSADLLGLC
jgi:hypothetical protein